MSRHASPRRSVSSGWRARFERLDAGFGSLLRALSVGGAVAACIIMLAMTADVVFRNLFNRSLAGTFEIVEVAMVLAVFMGLANAERSQTNVRVTLFTGLMPPQVAAWVRVFGLVVSLVIVAWFALASIDKAATAYAIGEYRRGIISFPMWPGRAIVALGFSMLAIELALGILRRMIAIMAPPPAPVRDADA